MVKSSRTFRLASKVEVDAEKAEYEAIEYEFEDPDAEPVPSKKGDGEVKAAKPRICTARYPGEGAMITMAASVGMSDIELSNPAGALFVFLGQVFDKADYKFLRDQVKESRLDLRQQVMPMVGDMMEEWSGVPTKQ